MSSFLAWYRAPRRPPSELGFAHVCGSAIRSGALLLRIGVIDAGLDSRRALGMLHWNAALVLAGRSCVIGWRGAPAGEVADPGRFAACRSAIPSVSGRTEWPAPQPGGGIRGA